MRGHAAVVHEGMLRLCAFNGSAEQEQQRLIAADKVDEIAIRSLKQRRQRLDFPSAARRNRNCLHLGLHAARGKQRTIDAALAFGLFCIAPDINDAPRRITERRVQVFHRRFVQNFDHCHDT